MVSGPLLSTVNAGEALFLLVAQLLLSFCCAPYFLRGHQLVGPLLSDMVQEEFVMKFFISLFFLESFIFILIEHKYGGGLSFTINVTTF